eukprot:jgi/Picre1/34738/NNA_002204.t1
MISSGKAVILALFLAVCIQAVEVYDGETFLDETKYTIEQNEDSIQIFENDLPGIDFVGGRSLLAEEEDCRVPKKEKQCREPRAPSSKSPPLLLQKRRRCMKPLQLSTHHHLPQYMKLTKRRP